MESHQFVFELKLLTQLIRDYDILVRVGHWEYLCDSYYFRIDRIFPDFLPRKRELVFKLLLEQWHRLILGMEPGDSLLLPFDFSDQYMGFFLVEFQNGVLTINPKATLEVCGHEVYPSNISTFSKSKPQLTYLTSQPWEKTEVSKEQLLREISGLIAKVDV